MKAKTPTLALAGRKHIPSAADNMRLLTKRIGTGPQQADHRPSGLRKPRNVGLMEWKIALKVRQSGESQIKRDETGSILLPVLGEHVATLSRKITASPYFAGSPDLEQMIARGDGDLPLSKPVKSAMLAAKPPVSGECRIITQFSKGSRNDQHMLAYRTLQPCRPRYVKCSRSSADQRFYKSHSF